MPRLSAEGNLKCQNGISSWGGDGCDPQLWGARALVLKLVLSAKRLLLLIDNWAAATLDLFAKKCKGVKVTVARWTHLAQPEADGGAVRGI